MFATATRGITMPLGIATKAEISSSAGRFSKQSRFWHLNTPAFHGYLGIWNQPRLSLPWLSLELAVRVSLHSKDSRYCAGKHLDYVENILERNACSWGPARRHETCGTSWDKLFERCVCVCVSRAGGIGTGIITMHKCTHQAVMLHSVFAIPSPLDSPG